MAALERAALSTFESEWFVFLASLDSVERAVVYEHELVWHDACKTGTIDFDWIRESIEKELAT